jgi:hypothetical protein
MNWLASLIIALIVAAAALVVVTVSNREQVAPLSNRSLATHEQLNR